MQFWPKLADRQSANTNARGDKLGLLYFSPRFPPQKSKNVQRRPCFENQNMVDVAHFLDF